MYLESQNDLHFETEEVVINAGYFTLKSLSERPYVRVPSIQFAESLWQYYWRCPEN